MVRLPPATDLIDIVLSVVGDPGVRSRQGSVLVLTPSAGWAERLVARLRRQRLPGHRGVGRGPGRVAGGGG